MEYRKRCQVCGKIFCYTDKDINNNAGNAALSALSALGGLASIFGGGTIVHTAVNNRNMQYYGDKVVDYSKCPYCGSRSIVNVSAEEWSKAQEQLTSEMGNVRRVEINSNATPEMLLKRAALFLEDEEWNNADAYAEAALDVEPENANAYVVKLMAELNVKELPGLPDCKEPFDNNNNYKKAIRFGDDETKAFLNECISQIKERNETQLLEQKYSEAVSLMKEAKTEQQYKQAAERFGAIASYKDAGSLVEECSQNAETARKDDIYNSALKNMNEDNSDTCQKALELFNTIRGWKDTDELIIACQKKIDELKRQEQLKAKKVKRIVTIAVPIVCAAIVFAIVLNTVIIPNGKYKDAVALMDEGKVVEAYEAFIALGDYKDSNEKAASIYDQYKIEMIKQAKVGDYVVFGQYEQDNDTSNGKEDVEWLVLDVQEDRALLISKYLLDSEPYNTTDDHVTWETCTLRKWLNDEFINTAFSDMEKAQIPTVTLSDDDFNNSMDMGNATQDRIFLLNPSDANRYFGSDDERKCNATYYAINRYDHNNPTINTDGSIDTGLSNEWWLRTFPDPEYYDGEYVTNKGWKNIINDTLILTFDKFIRPAMWVDLDA